LSALLYGAILGIIGFALLYVWVNTLSAVLALLGFLMYVLVYGYAKRKTEWGALVGTIPGAVPIVVGYTAYADRLDLSAFLLFLALVTWQMPHFYAISLYRLEEYKKAGIPIFAAKHGNRVTVFHILFFMAAFYAATAALFFYGFMPGMHGTSTWIYAVLMLCADLFWLWRGFQIFLVQDESLVSEPGIVDVKPKVKKWELSVVAPWARNVFFASLIVLLVFCVALSV
jgi:protoheme IX farnesyltransferase